MTTVPPAISLFAKEQFRMTRLQIFNWGTFSGLHDIPISERGFLFVGRSGAGKSTLLDAISALLVPPRWTDFNAAARESERSGRDRNLVTYVRGAWAEQKNDESGEIATRYLRTGTTWSALALSYKNAIGRTVVLAQIFWLRGNANGSTDIRHQYLIFEREFDLRELEDFGQSNFEIRKLKQSFPEAFIRDEFRAYCERFCRLLGIENEMALRLLHKTQSAKNLGDLNMFLRDFMLDKPDTFEVADRLVNEFGELNAAHQAVIIAREQIETLSPAREQYERMESFKRQRTAVDELRIGMNSYREMRRIALLTDYIASLHVQADGLEGQIRLHEEQLNNQLALLRDFERQHRGMGGDQIEHWENERIGLENQRVDRIRKRKQAEDACNMLGLTLPNSPLEFAELVGKARQELNDWQSGDSSQEQIFRMDREKTEAEKIRNEVRKEVDALRRQPSNIHATMLELRRDVAIAINVSEKALPFVGELLEVKPDEALWQGAIERVLRGFALSILVEERHYSALASYLNGIHLGRRLVYHRTSRPESLHYRPLGKNSLVFKLNLKEGGYADWLQAELRQHFDYSCVDSVQALRNTDRALTREGQIKHNKSRHEKDDRSSVNNRQNWVLGFDNREKLSIFEQQERELQDKISRLEGEIKVLMDKNMARANRAIQCQTLVNFQWQEIDIIPLLERIDIIDKQLKVAREGNTELQRIGAQIQQQKELVNQEDHDLRDLKATQKNILSKIAECQKQLESLRNDPSIFKLTPHQRQGLDERFSKLEPARLDNLDSLDRTVSKALTTEIEGLSLGISTCEKSVEGSFAEFIRRWRAEADGLDSTLAAAPDFFTKLVRLETDGLPDYEYRFFDLLRNQSHQNLAALSTYLNNARKAILERMELVNESLSQVPFNQSDSQRTYLYINVDDRQLPEVREFKQDIQQALSHAWSEDREFAESRFLALRGLVERLGSQAPEQKRWRESVLDVRQHIEFIGREIDESGDVIEIYRSGAGKSGGQRQKLATTCLAAALRYQLGGNDHGVPMYAPVVLDEAFDKADNEFTTLAMNIFTNFGFQMIVATPLKSVMTLEPFIGGACFVDISERRISGVLLIEYDNDRQRLKLPDLAREESVL